MKKTDSDIKIICLESEAFYALFDDVITHIKSELPTTPEKWITDDEVMKLLGIASKTTLQKYRDEGKIRFTQPSRKVILYDRDSILKFLENNAKNPF